MRILYTQADDGQMVSASDYATATPEESTESLLGKLSTRSLTADQATKLQTLVKSGIENTRQMLASDVGRCERELTRANKALDAFNKVHP